MGKIPEEFLKSLSSRMEEGEKVLFYASADRDDSGFCDICLAFTGKSLWMAVGPKVDKKVFRGFVNRLHLPEIPESHDYEKYTYSVVSNSEVERLEVINLVSGGQLTRVSGGQSFAMCSFTNAKAKDVGTFVMLFNRMKENGELTEEDLADSGKNEFCPKCGMLYPDPNHPVCPRCLKKGAVMMRVLKMAAPYKWMMIAVYALTIGAALLSLLIPTVEGEILYDETLTPGGKFYGQIVFIVLLIVLCRFLLLAMNVASNMVNVSFSAKLVYRLKTTVFKAMQRLSLSFFMNKQTGTLMTRINSDASGVHYFLVDGLTYIVTNVVIVIGATVIMLIKDWQLMLLCYIPILVIVFYLKKKFKVLGKFNWRRFLRRSTLNSAISDSVRGTRVIKAFGREKNEVERFGKINSNFRDIETAFNKQISTIFPINALVINAGGIIIWAFGGAQILGGVIQFGTLMTFINYINMIYGPMASLSDFVNWWANCMTSAQRIFEIVDAPTDVVEPETPKDKDVMQGNISLKNVSFGYDINKYVLRHITLDMKAGSMVGIVGHSGAGKSTLVNLISRFYDVNEGSIEIDGINVKDYSFEYLRKNIGIVSQDVYVFMGSVAENIAYAKPGCSREEILNAAKIANAHDFIEKLPDGYDTVIGPGGHDLSGGEKQRLSIARAVLHNPRILILDEATASLDTETERMIQEGLEALIDGRTTIAIAHRLSTLRNADYIVVVDNGEIVEQGKHMELLQSKGEYFRQVQKQTEALKVAGV